MIEEVIGGAFKVLARLVGQFFVEIVFELLLKGPGYFSSKRFSKQEPDPDGFVVVLTGFIIWVVIGFLAYGVYQKIGGSGHA